MRIIMENDKIIIYLKKCEISDLNIKTEDSLEDYVKKMISKLNDKYDIEFNGYYNVDIYNDINYGIIIEIENDDFDYYNYFDQIDMKINISNVPFFLYEIKYNYIDKQILKNSICYKYSNKLYLKVNNLNEKEYLKLLEFSNIIYGQKVDEILKISEKVKL